MYSLLFSAGVRIITLIVIYLFITPWMKIHRYFNQSPGIILTYIFNKLKDSRLNIHLQLRDN